MVACFVAFAYSSIEHPPLTALVVFGEGRSGTTWLAEALEFIDPNNIFVFGEPFYAFKKEPGDLVPQYHELFSCNAFARTDWMKLLWSYSCKPWVKYLGSAFLRRCRQEKNTEADRLKLFQACTSRPIRIVKTIRYSQRSEFELQSSDIEAIWKLNMNLKFIYTDRNVNDVISSRFIHGWLGNSNIEDLSIHLCNSLIRDCKVLGSLTAETVMLAREADPGGKFSFLQVQYEDLSPMYVAGNENARDADNKQHKRPKYVEGWEKLKDFLGLPYSLSHILKSLDKSSKSTFGKIHFSSDLKLRRKQLEMEPVEFSKYCVNVTEADLHCQWD